MIAFAFERRLPKDRLPAPSPNYNQIGAMMQGRAAHDARRAATLKAHFQIGSGLSLQYGDALAGPFQQIPPKLRVSGIGRPNFRCRYCMNEAELGLIRLCQIHRVSDQAGTLGHQVNRAKNAAAFHMLGRRWIFRVCSGPNSAVCVVKHFRSNRAQQQTTEFPIAVRRHHDQVDVLLLERMSRSRVAGSPCWTILSI